MLDFGYYNMDCMEGMKEFPDKFFDLAIVDPPYGGGDTQSDKAGLVGGGADYERRDRSRFGGRFDKYHIGTADGREMGEKISNKRGYL